MTYWRATVQRPDGAGGWTTVGVFGTPDTPGTGTARYLHGDTARYAAQLVLSHVWPIDLEQFNKREHDSGKWVDRDRAYTGIAEHRIIIDVCEEYLWSVPGRTAPPPQTFTVAELRLADVHTEVLAFAEAKARLAELTDQVRLARGDVRHKKWRAEEACKEATRAGVAETDIAKARRLPRRPTKPKTT